jgi:plasmid stability protein
MADVLVRNLSESVVSSLKEKAELNKRSLQAELAAILEREATFHNKKKGLATELRAIQTKVAEDSEPYSTDSAKDIRNLRDGGLSNY